MVISKIDPSIHYNEIKSVDIKDLEKEVDMYQTYIDNTEVIIALGQPQNKYEEFNILYFPVYLVKSNNKVIQIGVYEILANQLELYLDEDSSLDILKIKDEPLLYSYVNNTMLNSIGKKPEVSLNRLNTQDEESDIDVEDEQNVPDEDKKEDIENIYNRIPESRQDIFLLTEGIVTPNILKEETKIINNTIINSYEESDEDTWINKFMKNNNYSIQDNEGGGDCLFATIRDAFSSIGQQTNINKLRKKVSDNCTEQNFKDYKGQYEMYNSTYIEETRQIKELAEKYKDLKKKFESTKDRSDQKELYEAAKLTKMNHDKLIREREFSKSMLEDFKFMKNIKTLDEFKSAVRKCSFWADIWTISLLEQILNIKFIILSSQAYESDDIANILQCGETNEVIQNEGIFTPEFYIMVDYTGDHYKLIGYKKKMIFIFKEIPYQIKEMIVHKCLEKNSGGFALIPDFQKFVSKVNPALSINEAEIESSDDLNEIKMMGLYDENTVFQFYSKSVDKYPGKGSGEKIEKENIENYKELNEIDNWRKKLSNFYVETKNEKIVPIVIDNHKWASVEHYYQASKFKENNPEFYLSFSLDSGTELSKDPAMAKSAGGKTGKYKKELIRPKEVNIDGNFFNGRHKEEMEKAQRAKFTQNAELKDLLLKTKKAKLTHYSRGSPPITFEYLMVLREELKR